MPEEFYDDCRIVSWPEVPGGVLTVYLRIDLISKLTNHGDQLQSKK